jgi:methylthioribulose-1-phosphate dehydratase
MLSDIHASQQGLTVEGYEMLKGLTGIASHEHREWVPIVDNDQDMPRMAQRVGSLLEQQKAAHGFLIRGHGLYTWGATLQEAARHVEIFEFLFEVAGRRSLYGNRHHSGTGSEVRVG